MKTNAFGILSEELVSCQIEWIRCLLAPREATPSNKDSEPPYTSNRRMFSSEERTRTRSIMLRHNRHYVARFFPSYYNVTPHMFGCLAFLRVKVGHYLRDIIFYFEKKSNFPFPNVSIDFTDISRIP